MADPLCLLGDYKTFYCCRPGVGNLTLETQGASLNLTAHLSAAVPTSQSGFVLKKGQL